MFGNQMHIKAIMRSWDPNTYEKIRIFSKRTMTSQEKNQTQKEPIQNHLPLDQMSYGRENCKQCLPGELVVSLKGNWISIVLGSIIAFCDAPLLYFEKWQT